MRDEEEPIGFRLLFGFSEVRCVALADGRYCTAMGDGQITAKRVAVLVVMLREAAPHEAETASICRVSLPHK